MEAAARVEDMNYPPTKKYPERRRQRPQYLEEYIVDVGEGCDVHPSGSSSASHASR